MDTSPLSRVPSEIQKRVATMALSHEGTVPLSCLSSYNGLTCVCRKLRQDTWMVFWELNTFHDQEPTDKTDIRKHTTQLQTLLSQGVIKHMHNLDLSLELRTATPQTWKVSITFAPKHATDCEKLVASGNDRIAQGRVWVFSRYLDRILHAYQQAGFEVYATAKFGRKDGEIRKFWAVKAGQ